MKEKKIGGLEKHEHEEEYIIETGIRQPEKPLDEIESKHDKQERHNHNIDKIQESIHESAVSAKEVNISKLDKDNSDSKHILGIHRELKQDAYKQTIQRVRSALPPIQRSFSKLIHNKTIEPLSEVTSKTIARPSGILSGGIIALVGSSVVLYMARFYGFRYNFSLFFILLGVGFVFGLLAEIGIHIIRMRKK